MKVNHCVMYLEFLFFLFCFLFFRKQQSIVEILRYGTFTIIALIGVLACLE